MYGYTLRQLQDITLWKSNSYGIFHVITTHRLKMAEQSLRFLDRHIKNLQYIDSQIVRFGRLRDIEQKKIDKIMVKNGLKDKDRD